MSEKKSSTKSIKKRNWGFVVYPTKEQLEKIGSVDYDGADGYGTLPDDWRERLQLSGLQYAISPLHDKDKLEDGSGRIKKPHYHVIVVYGNPTTFNNVKSFTNSLNAPIPQALEQIRGYYRYLTHKDNPDKFQYDEKDIQTGGGFNISDFVELSKSEVTEIKFKLQMLIREKEMEEYEEFMDYVQDNFDRTVYDVASNNTIFFNTYIKSKRHYKRGKQDKKPKMLVDEETGEVIDSLEKLQKAVESTTLGELKGLVMLKGLFDEFEPLK